METRRLGNSSLEVSALGFGCMGLNVGYGPGPAKKDALHAQTPEDQLHMPPHLTANCFGEQEQDMTTPLTRRDILRSAAVAAAALPLRRLRQRNPGTDRSQRHLPRHAPPPTAQTRRPRGVGPRLWLHERRMGLRAPERTGSRGPVGA